MGSRVNIYIFIFAFKFSLRCLQPDTVPIICHRVDDTGEKFAASVVASGVMLFSETWEKMIHEKKT